MPNVPIFSTEYEAQQLLERLHLDVNTVDNSYETLCAQLFTKARFQQFRVLDRTCTVVGRCEPWFDEECYSAERLAYKALHDFQCTHGNLDNFLMHRSAYYNLCKQK